MTSIEWTSIGVVEKKHALWRRIHWERLMLLALNAGLWAFIVGLFT